MNKKCITYVKCIPHIFPNCEVRMMEKLIRMNKKSGHQKCDAFLMSSESIDSHVVNIKIRCDLCFDKALHLRDLLARNVQV